MHLEIHTDLGMENYFQHFKMLTYQSHWEAKCYPKYGYRSK